MSTNTKSWSDADAEQLVFLYTTEDEEDRITDPAELGKVFNKSHRSVISKLVQLGVYQKPENNKGAKRTVKTMLRELEIMLEIEIDGTNLNKKENLTNLVDALKRKLGQ